MDITDKIIAFECGLLEDTGVLELFAELISSGMAWTLQGSYGRTASALIDAGYIDTNGNITHEDYE